MYSLIPQFHELEMAHSVLALYRDQVIHDLRLLAVRQSVMNAMQHGHHRRSAPHLCLFDGRFFVKIHPLYTRFSRLRDSQLDLEHEREELEKSESEPLANTRLPPRREPLFDEECTKIVNSSSEDGQQV